MTECFGNALAEELFLARRSKAFRPFPAGLHRAARCKLLYLHDADELADLSVPPGDHLETLKGRRRGYYAIRINDQWRVVFTGAAGNARDVAVAHYH